MCCSICAAGDNTDRIKRRVRRQSSREGTVANGGGCTVSHMLAHHHRHPSMSSTSSSAAAAAGSAAIHNTYFAPQRRWKNSRRTSRNVNHIGGIGNGGDQRGLPKKGGAGGKGVWGLLGSELLVEEDVCDVNDPNYDSEANDANTELLEVIAVPTADELYKLMVPTLLEYYENGDTHEALQSLREVMLANGAAKVPHLMISGAIELSMNHKDSHREMTSLLISEAYGELVKSEDIVAGFNVLLANLDDLVLDTPEAPTWLGNFIARAVADDCVPPIYVSANQEKEDAEVEANGSKNGDANGVDVAAAAAAGKGRRSSLQKGQLARAAFKRADSLLSLKATMVHLDNIWGSAGPLRPVKSITMSMALLLNEFKDSRDLAEAQRCLHALEVPHYHHELVYEAIVMALEAAGAQQVEEAMCTLLRSMDESCLVSPAMMEQVSGRSAF